MHGVIRRGQLDNYVLQSSLNFVYLKCKVLKMCNYDAHIAYFVISKLQNWGHFWKG